MNLFKTKKEYRVVEFDQRPKPMVVDDEAIGALAHHPGFLLLMNDLKLQRQFLLNELQSGKHESLRDVDRLQIGLSWLGYLQSIVDRKVFKRTDKQPTEATLTEREQFDQVMAQIEGIKPPQAVSM